MQGNLKIRRYRFVKRFQILYQYFIIHPFHVHAIEKQRLSFSPNECYSLLKSKGIIELKHSIEILVKTKTKEIKILTLLES